MNHGLGGLLWKRDDFEARRQHMHGSTPGFSICEFSDS